MGSQLCMTLAQTEDGKTASKAAQPVSTAATAQPSLQPLLSALAAACHCPAVAETIGSDEWRECLMRIAADGDKPTEQRISALDLLYLSLTSAAQASVTDTSVVEWLFQLVRDSSPESAVFAGSAYTPLFDNAGNRARSRVKSVEHWGNI